LAQDGRLSLEGPSDTRQKPVTIKDVAQQAGVSLMTVSAVLNGKAVERRISKITEVRVRETARLMQYSPNAVARSLRRRSTNVVGVYSGIGYLNASNPFLAELIGGFQVGCDEYQKDLLLHGTFRGRSVDDIYAELVDGRLDGLIVQAPPSDPLVDRLAESHLPVVAAVDAIPSVTSVVADDAGGSTMLGEYLLERGHRQMLYVRTTSPLVSALRRLESFRAFAVRAGVSLVEYPDEHGCAAVAAAVRDSLKTSVAHPTAVVCWADSAAFEVIAQLEDKGIRVPADIAVVGFDGFAPPPGFGRRLTTIRAPWSEVGHRAVGLLVEKLAGRPVPPETELPVELIAGHTA
jgi:LacI family transcriptional regulator